MSRHELRDLVTAMKNLTISPDDGTHQLSPPSLPPRAA
jgi:hypothetical protein